MALWPTNAPSLEQSRGPGVLGGFQTARGELKAGERHLDRRTVPFR